ncbi:methylthioribose-1-phosphate isomerase [Cetobacterium ceti]|uniref:Methylthioribose-1-phosphate isomerase n=1 Tax=Cetobacterium ceti TaxID=180163 RepID=A0A1T4MB41_9FUSO|nr:S-methyl-5-thioribose-1-phosphate isomerase [Cetobacterium ceti]SJZ64066.1 methylthioribose-1-phosphate isomerase [Cetobacterium ceti]
MKRMDEGLAFMLQYENVAWYDNGKVRILDRRVYPREIKFVECTTYKEVQEAITNMVTQSAGPYTAAGMGMALAAYECRDKSPVEQLEFLKNASHIISHARPTTVNRMKMITEGCYEAGEKALEKGESPIEAIFKRTFDSLERRYRRMSKVAKNLVDLFPENGKVMTQCFGETIVGCMGREIRNQNKTIEFYCPETRPYLQGARLTASVLKDQGFKVTVITDNMPAWTIREKKIDVFTSAADTICMDGHIVNKVGTMQIAIAAKYFGIPYFVTGIPDEDKLLNNIVIEERDPKDVLESNGIKNTLEGVGGYYPSFDITPPELVSGVVTDNGVFTPYNLSTYFERETEQYY